MRGALAALALVACAPVPPPPAGPATAGPLDLPTAPCRADRAAAFVGRPVAALPPLNPPGGVRVIRPGEAVTDDLNPGRLNLPLDAAGRIAAAYCV